MLSHYEAAAAIGVARTPGKAVTRNRYGAIILRRMRVAPIYLDVLGQRPDARDGYRIKT